MKGEVDLKISIWKKTYVDTEFLFEGQRFALAVTIRPPGWQLKAVAKKSSGKPALRAFIESWENSDTIPVKDERFELQSWPLETEIETLALAVEHWLKKFEQS